jgi:hypothetical protein
MHKNVVMSGVGRCISAIITWTECNLHSIVEEKCAHHRVTFSRPVRADQVTHFERACDEPLALASAQLHGNIYKRFLVLVAWVAPSAPVKLFANHIGTREEGVRG